MKKNCYRCKHLEYIDNNSYEIPDGGYFCNKRNYKNEKQEGDHLDKLNVPNYREKSKKCFESR